MKNIIITGASGFIAGELTSLLLSKDENHLFLLSTNPSKLNGKYNEAGRIDCFTLEEFKAYNKNKEIEYHCLVNAGFARSFEGNKLADALIYTFDLMQYAKTINLKTFVNISSQGVYGHLYEPLWTEKTPAAPDDMYALGKYSAELMSHSAFQGTDIKYTNIRLSSVCENRRFLGVFCKNALNGMPIKLTAPEQVTSFIDVKDVATALKAVIDLSSGTTFAPVYNLGTNECYTIGYLAELVKMVGKESFDVDVEIIKEGSANTGKIGMDSTLFYNTFKWKPSVSIKEMIISLFKYNSVIIKQ